MKRSLLAASLFASLGIAPLALGLTTDRDFFARLLEKNGLTNGLFQKSKIACVCQGGALAGKAGVASYNNSAFTTQLTVLCMVPGFDSQGNFVTGSFCSTFDVIAK